VKTRNHLEGAKIERSGNADNFRGLIAQHNAKLATFGELNDRLGPIRVSKLAGRCLEGTSVSLLRLERCHVYFNFPEPH